MKPRESFDGVTADAISAIAALFDCNAEQQEFSLPNDEQGVWQVHYRAETGNIRVLLWPAMSRIDVTVGPHMWVVKGVREIEVIRTSSSSPASPATECSPSLATARSC